MAIIRFEGSTDAMVWKSPIEILSSDSQVEVDEVHEALLMANGTVIDLLTEGLHSFSAEKYNLTAVEGGSGVRCKIFYISRTLQMKLLWGTQGQIPLEDPLYDIFLHVMLHGSMQVSICDSGKFMLKLVGFQSFVKAALIEQFRGIISTHVKDAVSKIMVNGRLSFFMMNSNLLDLSASIEERLQQVFYDYGVEVSLFNIEAIEVPPEDYKEISDAKKHRAMGNILGYTWQEERRMMIAEKYAENAGAAVQDESFRDICRRALQGGDAPQKKTAAPAPVEKEPVKTVERKQRLCPHCGNPIEGNPKFCPECGEKLVRHCPNCGNPIEGAAKFCPECGQKL